MTSLSVVTRPRTVTEDLGASLTAQGAEVVAQLAWAVERGVFADLLSTYQRLLLRVGRSISDAPPMRSAISDLKTIFPLGSTKLNDRLVMLHQYLLPACRNITALDSERHWRVADALVKGWCLAEAAKHRQLAQTVPSIVDDFTTPETVEQMVKAHEAEADVYERLADGKGWA